MNIMKIIHYIMVYMVGFIAIVFIRLLVLPPILIFLPGLRTPAITHAWEGIMHAASSVMGYIVAAILVLWIVYEVLRRIFPISLFIGKMSPFKELKQSGLFGLISDVVGIVASGDSIKNRILRLGRSIGMFVKNNITMLSNETKALLGIKVPRAAPVPPTADPEDETSDSPFTSDDQARMSEEYQQCVEENTTIITPNMSSSDVATANLHNSTVPAICKVKSFQSGMNIFASRV